MLERFGYKNLVAAVYITALFMQIMDSTIINVALPTLANEFDVEATAMDWTVLSFTIALAVMTASAGWFGQRLGLRRTFMVALGGFVFTSLLCGVAQSLNQLVVARALQGAAAGLITPIGSALLFNAFPIEERSIASRKVITVAVIAPALGPIVGGAILEFTSWRWIFFVNLPIGALALLLAWKWLLDDDTAQQTSFDTSGFFLLAGGLGLTLYGLSRGGERGWASAPIMLSLVLGLGMLAMLVVVELRKREPLLHLRLLTERNFGWYNLVSLPVYAGFISLIYLLPLFLQQEAGHSPLQVGLALFPQPLGVLVTSQLVGRFLYKRIGPRRLILLGAVLAFAVGSATAQIDAGVDLWWIRALMFVRGLAMGLFFVPIQSAVYARTERPAMGQATAIYGTTRQVAPAVGVAIASMVLANGIAGTTVVGERVSGYQTAMLASALMFAVAGLLALRLRDTDAAATMAG
ncbi:MAG: DHA2 family efflux MFS transporter permease subunit [Acidimicrobiales bacterium]